MKKIKVLFLAANPKGTSSLQLDEEIRAITQKIRSSDYRDLFELVSVWAVRADDLLQAFNEHKPDLVHFSGHGSSEGEIVLVDNSGVSRSVTKQAITTLFKTLKDNIRVVFLNACYSKSQSEAITEVIDCAIGMNTAIGDQAAIIFAASFYRAIGFGRSVQQAFEQGKTALLLEGYEEDKIPELIVRKGVDASRITFIDASAYIDNTGVQKNDSSVQSIIDSQHIKLWGREKEVEQIIGELRNPKGKTFVAISGLGGIGKTSLALAITELSQKENLFKRFIWESSKIEVLTGNQLLPVQPSFQSLQSLLVNILAKLEVNTGKLGKKDLLPTLARELERQKVLIIIDNLEDAVDYKNIIANLVTNIRNNKSRFIFTLRPQMTEYSDIHSINLQGLKESDSISFLRDEGSTRGIKSVGNAEDKYLRSISQAIGGAPLAGKLVISQLTRMPMEAVLENLEQAKGEMELVYLFIYRKSWQILSLPSRKVLLSMPTFPAPINKSILERVSTVNGNDLIDALAELIQLSLVNVNDSILDHKRKYSIHQLTRNFLQTELIQKWT